MCIRDRFSHVPPFRPEPEAAHVKTALDLLQKAERPIIVAGGGARASGAGRELVALAEALQIPVATSLNGKDCIPGTHPLSVGVVGSYSRETANRAVNRADLVCFIAVSYTHLPGDIVAATQLVKKGKVISLALNFCLLYTSRCV